MVFEPAPYTVYTACRQVLYQLYLHVHVHIHVHGKKHVYSILAKGKLERRSERASTTHKTQKTQHTKRKNNVHVHELYRWQVGRLSGRETSCETVKETA